MPRFIWRSQNKHEQDPFQMPATLEVGEYPIIDTTAKAVGRWVMWRTVETGNPTADAIDHLRMETLDKMHDELVARIRTNPTPTVAERNMGAYIESLEPQVRAAVMDMRSKGYSTRASGFIMGSWREIGIYYGDPNYNSEPDERAQIIDFYPFSLDAEARGQVAQAGGEIISHPATPELVSRIGFSTDTADLAVMETTWNSIAAALPDTGNPAPAVDPIFAAGAFRINSQDIGLTADQINASPLAAGESMGSGPSDG